MNDNLESRVIRLEVITEQIGKTLDELKNDMRDLRSDMSTQFRWIVGIQFTILLGILANLILRH